MFLVITIHAILCVGFMFKVKAHREKSIRQHTDLLLTVLLPATINRLHCTFCRGRLVDLVAV